MAKAKAKPKEKEKTKKQDNITLGSEIFNTPKEILKISPAIDLAIGGGVPKGSVVILSGPPKGGKSSLAVHMVRKFQKQFNKGRCLYVDVETRFKKVQLFQDDLEKEKIEVLRSDKNKILMAEDFLEKITEFCKTNSDSIIVIDSTSALCSTTEFTDPITGKSRSLGPKLLANFCRKIAPIIPVQDNILVLITHVIANTSGYGSPFMSDSGNKIQYQSDISLLCKKGKPWIEDGMTIGQENTWKVIWTALGAPPGMEVQSYLRYFHGIDEIKELVDIGLQTGLLRQAGAWFYADFMEEHSEALKKKHAELIGKDIEKAFTFQGKDSLSQWIAENEDIYELLYKELNGMLHGVSLEE